MNAASTEDWVAGMLAPETPAPQGVERGPCRVPAVPAAPANGAGAARVAAAEGTGVGAGCGAGVGKSPMELPAELPKDLPDRFVTFQVEDETYGLDVLRVREVLRSAEMVPVPGAPDSVLGVINLRGSIVPVIDARHRLGLAPAGEDALYRVLVLESGRQAVGLRVDSVAEVTPVGEGEYEPPPPVGPDSRAPYVRGVLRRETGFVVLVDVDDLLPLPAGAAQVAGAASAAAAGP